MFVTVSTVLFALAPSAKGQPSVSGYTELRETFDALIERQSLGLQAMYLGGQGILDTGRTCVTPYAFIGGYEYDSIMGGLGASVQTEALLPLGVGAGFGVMDADVRSYTFALHAQKKFAPTAWSKLLLQGVGAIERKSGERGRYYAIYLKPAQWPDTPEGLVLFEDLVWYSFYLHAVLEARWRIVKPLLDIGWLASRYRYSGYQCGNDCFQLGPSTSGHGTIDHLTFGLGVSLDLGPVQLFGGFIGTGNEGVLPVSLSIEF